jgi:hypothetical protein
VEGERQLKGIDRIEPKAFPKQWRVGFDARWFDVLKRESLNDDCFDLGG